MDEPRKSIILVVRDEDLFAELLPSFPPDRYTLLFAVESAEALSLCESRRPDVVLLPRDDVRGQLGQVLFQLRGERTSLLSVGPEDGDAASSKPEAGVEGWDEAVDHHVFTEKMDRLVAVLREALNERRRHPRVYIEFPVELEGDEEAVVQDVSEGGLQVTTHRAVSEGDQVGVRLGWGEDPAEFTATVGAVREEMLGGRSVVLHVHEKDQDARTYLRRLVRRVLEVQHYLKGQEAKGDGVRGPVAWKLARRAEQTIRDSQEISVRDSQDIAVFDEKSRDIPVASFDGLEGRYELGEVEGRWGVGEVRRATHKLLKKPVLVKTLEPNLASDRLARKRLEQEACEASSLSFPGIVDVLDFGDDGGGRLYYAMEGLLGKRLCEWSDSREGVLSPRDVARMGVVLSEALARAHLRGKGHFDVCPENIYLKRARGGLLEPIFINVSGRECWGPASATHASGGAHRPPWAPMASPPPSVDVFELSSTLFTVLNSAKEGALTEGGRALREALVLAMGGEEAQEGAGFQDAAELTHALRGCWAALEREEAGRPAHIVEPSGREAAKGSRSTRSPTTRVRRVSTGRNKKVASKKETVRGFSVEGGAGSDASVAPRRDPGVTGEKPDPPAETLSSKSQELAPPHPSEDLLHSSVEAPGRQEPKPKSAPDEGEASVSGGEELVSHLIEEELQDKETVATVDLPPEKVKGGAVEEGGSGKWESDGASRPGVEGDGGGQGIDAEGEIPLAPDEPTEGASHGPRLRRLFWVGGGAVVLVLCAGVALAVLRPWESGGGKKQRQGGNRAGRHASRVQGLVAGGGVDAGDDEAPKGKGGRDAGRDAGVIRALAGDATPGPSGDGGGEVEASPQDGGAPLDEGKAEEKLTWTDLLGKARRRIGRGKIQEALDYLNRALKIRDGARLRYLFSRCYSKRGKVWPAIYHLRKAVKSRPKWARYRYRLGKLYLKIGKKKTACRHLLKATRYRPASRRYKKTLKESCGK